MPHRGPSWLQWLRALGRQVARFLRYCHHFRSCCTVYMLQVSQVCVLVKSWKRHACEETCSACDYACSRFSVDWTQIIPACKGWIMKPKLFVLPHLLDTYCFAAGRRHCLCIGVLPSIVLGCDESAAGNVEEETIAHKSEIVVQRYTQPHLKWSSAFSLWIVSI